MFLYPQAYWNPQRDLNKSLREYAVRYFGDSELVEYFRELTLGLQDVLKICKYEQPGDAWDSLRVDKEPDEALRYHVEGLEQGLRGPLASANSRLESAIRKTQSEPYRARLERERVSMGFTLGQARLYYHLLKGEWLYRIHKSHQDPDAALGMAIESVLARHIYEDLKKFVGRSGIKGEPLVPDPAVMADRVRELQGEGYSVWGIVHRMRKGVNGYIVESAFGSRAVVWTDMEGSKPAMEVRVAGLSWRDEFGQPFAASSLTLSSSPAIVEGPGFSTIKLFDALMASQV
jgi:hypothetical protein